MSKLEFREGVAALQEMFRSEGDYREAWSADVIAATSRDIYSGWNMVSAWKDIPKARVAAALDAVRNHLLNFLLDLKEQHPEVEDSAANLGSISKDDVSVIVTNNIYGGHNVLASGATVHQQVLQEVMPGDLESLLSALQGAFLPEDLVDKLTDAIAEDEPTRKGGIGAKVGEWLTTLGEKAATSTVATFAAQALLRYYGMAGT